MLVHCIINYVRTKTVGGILMRNKGTSVVLIFLLVSILASAVEITAWVTYGGVMGNILKDLIETDFTPKTGITVNYEPYIIDGSYFMKVLLAVATGDAPDVMTLGAAQVVDLAVRNALVDLSAFPDFDEAVKDIYPGALRTLNFKDHIYGLPFELGWTIAYYRTDMFSDYGLTPPNTWDELKRIIPKVQAQGKTAWISTIGNTTDGQVRAFFPFIYQRNSDIFTEDGLRSNLDSKEAQEAFTEFTSFYTDLNMPLEMPEVQAFSDGEMPYMVSLNYLYSMLTRGKPQLLGKWGVTQVPGTPQPDGSINRYVPLSSFAFAIPNNKDPKKVEASWEFLKWIASDEVQREFQKRIYESPEEWMLVFGTKGTANPAIFRGDDFKIIDNALKESQGPKAVVGGYQTYRYIGFAFSKTVMQNQDPKKMILEAAKESNTELQRKQKEFARFVEKL